MPEEILESPQVVEPKATNWPKIILVAVFGFALLAGAAYAGYWYGAQQAQRLEKPFPDLLKTPTPTPISKESPSYKIAYYQLGESKEAGDLWVANYNGSGKKKLTPTTIYEVHPWSPDNKYIAVVLQEPSGQNRVVWSVGAVNASTGEVIKLKESTGGPIYNLYWLDNDTIVYASGKQIETVSVSTKSANTIFKTDPSNTDDTELRLTQSPDRKWLTYYYAGQGEGSLPQVDYNRYSFNVITKTSKVVLEKGYIVGWRGQKIVYSLADFDQHQTTIWEVNVDGTGAKELISVNSTEITDIIVAQNGDGVFYVTRDYERKPYMKAFVHNFATSQATEIVSVEAPSGIGELTASPDGKYLSYSVGGLVFIYDPKTKEKFEFCSGTCRDLSWSN